MPRLELPLGHLVSYGTRRSKESGINPLPSDHLYLSLHGSKGNVQLLSDFRDRGLFKFEHGNALQELVSQTIQQITNIKVKTSSIS